MAKKNQALAATDDAAALEKFAGYEEFEGLGYENVTQDHIKVPFMVLLQAMSPKVVDDIEGFKAGKWWNTVTDDTWDRDEGFLFVPATVRHYFAEWGPRDSNVGFQGHHEASSSLVARVKKQAAEEGQPFGQNKMENGNRLIETFYIHGVQCNEDGSIYGPAVIYCKATHIKPYKNWMSKLNMFRVNLPNGRSIVPPLPCNLVRISSVQQKNDRGTFYVPKFSAGIDGDLKKSLLSTDDERFIAAKNLKEMVEKGDATIDPETVNEESHSEEVSNETPF
jgi:hypothetical protein